MGNYIGKLTQCTLDSTGIVNKYHVFFSMYTVRAGLCFSGVGGNIAIKTVLPPYIVYCIVNMKYFMNFIYLFFFHSNFFCADASVSG